MTGSCTARLSESAWTILPRLRPFLPRRRESSADLGRDALRCSTVRPADFSAGEVGGGAAVSS